MKVTHKLTRNQVLVFNILLKAETPLSAYTILDHLREEGVHAPLQIYRALNKLLDYGMVHRLESLNTFVACTHSHNGHHGLFAICKRCSQVLEFSDAVIERQVYDWALHNDFTPTKITMEIRGICTHCTNE